MLSEHHRQRRHRRRFLDRERSRIDLYEKW